MSAIQDALVAQVRDLTNGLRVTKATLAVAIERAGGSMTFSEDELASALASVLKDPSSFTTVRDDEAETVTLVYSPNA